MSKNPNWLEWDLTVWKGYSICTGDPGKSQFRKEFEVENAIPSGAELDKISLMFSMTFRMCPS